MGVALVAQLAAQTMRNINAQVAQMQRRAQQTSPTSGQENAARREAGANEPAHEFEGSQLKDGESAANATELQKRRISERRPAADPHLEEHPHSEEHPESSNCRPEKMMKVQGSVKSNRATGGRGSHMRETEHQSRLLPLARNGSTNPSMRPPVSRV